jgi:hypothetical protein
MNPITHPSAPTGYGGHAHRGLIRDVVDGGRS